MNMLFRKLLRPFCGSERTGGVIITLENFTKNNTRTPKNSNSTSFSSLSILSTQLERDAATENKDCKMRFRQRQRYSHLFRHKPINVTFTAPLSLSSLRTSSITSSITSTCRQLHTSMSNSTHVLQRTPPTTAVFILHHHQQNNNHNHSSSLVGGTLKLKENSITSKYLTVPNYRHMRPFSTQEPPISSTITIKDGLQTKASVAEFLEHLTDEQKGLLYHSLNIDVLRDKYEGHLGSSKSESHHYLSRFGRPAAAAEPTGTLCEVPPTWLHARLDEKMVPAGAAAVWAVGLKNALPFVGFGFLDNLIMILAGDYIDVTLGTMLGISTMAAAALGNTISDVAGIGSAWYIEDLANKIGIKDPKLTPSQFASWPIRWASNGGRAIGVIIGCLLGMVPLLFLPSPEEKEREEKEKAAKEKASSVGNTATVEKEKSTKN